MLMLHQYKQAQYCRVLYIHICNISLKFSIFWFVYVVIIVCIVRRIMNLTIYNSYLRKKCYFYRCLCLFVVNIVNPD